MEQKITIKGIEFPFDIMDLETSERYEAAMKAVTDEINALDLDNMANTDAMREQMRIVQKCFSTVLGEDVPKKIFCGRLNLREHLEAFKELFDAANEQSSSFASTARSIMGTPNREQRRAAKK